MTEDRAAEMFKVLSEQDKLRMLKPMSIFCNTFGLMLDSGFVRLCFGTVPPNIIAGPSETTWHTSITIPTGIAIGLAEGINRCVSVQLAGEELERREKEGLKAN